MEFLLTPDTLHWPSLSAGSNDVQPLAPPQAHVSMYDSALGPALQPSIGLNYSYPVTGPGRGVGGCGPVGVSAGAGTGARAASSWPWCVPLSLALTSSCARRAIA